MWITGSILQEKIKLQRIMYYNEYLCFFGFLSLEKCQNLAFSGKFG